MSARHFLNICDLTVSELQLIIALAETPVADLGTPLKNHGVALIFEKPSNRTRQSMEIAVMQLGGHPIYTRGEEVGIDGRETAEDVAAVLSGYHGVIAARVFRHAAVERMAAVATVPVINMLSDHSHPLQALADILTMKQNIGQLAGKKVAWVGDYNNVARSLAEAAVMMKMNIEIATPHNFGPNDVEIKRLSLLGEGSVIASNNAIAAVTGASCVHTDVWVSMGQESQATEKEALFADFKVTTNLMARALPGAYFYHCLPAHRGHEVDAEVIDGPSSRVIHQAHNRLHSARGLLAFVLKDKRPTVNESALS